MGSIAGVRGGLLTALQTIAGLRVYARVPDQVNAPFLYVHRTGITPHTTLATRGCVKLNLLVGVSPAQGSERAQAALEAYQDMTGASSIIAALEADETLGGAAEHLLIGDWSPDQAIEFGGQPFDGATLPVEIHYVY
jgi:hypothetical protein